MIHQICITLWSCFRHSRHSLDSFDTLRSHLISALTFDQMAYSDCDIVRKAFPSVTFHPDCRTDSRISCDSKNKITRLYVSSHILHLQCLIIHDATLFFQQSVSHASTWFILFILHSSFILGILTQTNRLVPFHLSWDSSRISQDCKSYCRYLLSPATPFNQLPIIKTSFVFFILHSSWF
jgi:hypothetical protein